jgi:hypothetical protein
VITSTEDIDKKSRRKWDYPTASALEVLYIIIMWLSIKLILCVSQTPLFIAFAGAKKFLARDFRGAFWDL